MRHKRFSVCGMALGRSGCPGRFWVGLRAEQRDLPWSFFSSHAGSGDEGVTVGTL